LAVRPAAGRPARTVPPHYFGQVASEGEPGRESDRLTVRWVLASPRVEERLEGRLPGRADDERRVAAAERLIESEPGESGLRLPTAVAEPEGSTVSLEIPFDLESVERHEPTGVRRWRHAVRDAFRIALDRKLAVDDFAVVSVGHERRSFYLLPSAPPAPEGRSPSA